MRSISKVILLSISLITLVKSFSQKQVNDTIVLRRGVADTLRNKVFIDPNKNSKYYEQLTNFSYDENYFSDMAKVLQDSASKKAQPNKVTNLPKKWLPLYLYKGNYYLYVPCDGIFIYKILITDKYICESDGEPLHPREFNSLRMISKTSYTNSETNYWWHEKDLRVDIIDKQKGVAVFSTRRIDDNSIHYRLMVDANNVKLFSVIKNNCHGAKESEFNFEEPDFEKLLGKK